MANYNPMKKDELIKVLKEKDAEISGLTRDCEGMTEECNNLHNTINGLKDDLKKSNEICERLTKEKNVFKIEKNALKTIIESKDNVITVLKRHRVILGIITIAAILIAIIF